MRLLQIALLGLQVVWYTGQAFQLPPAAKVTIVEARRERRPSVLKNRESDSEERIEAAMQEDKKHRPRQVLLALAAMYASNQWCRAVLFSTVNFASSDAYRFLNAGVGLSESQYALLSTIAFNALFSAASLVAGALVDRADPRLASALACGLWSLATAALGGANSFTQVAILRSIQGLAMAVTAPAGYAILARSFAPSKLATANSNYATAVSVGGALASASVILDERLGWRDTFRFTGGTGILVALFAGAALLYAAPPMTETRQNETRNEATPFWDLGGGFATVAILLATALRFCAGFSIAVFAIPVFRSFFPDKASDFGVAYGIVVAICGSASALLGGRLADALAARHQTKTASVLPWPFDRNPNAARALVPCLGSLLAAPLWLAAVQQSQSLQAALFCLGLEFLFAECWIGTTTSLLATQVNPDARGKAQGTFTASTLIGNGAPIAIGYAIENSLIWNGNMVSIVNTAVVASYLASALAFVLVASLVATDDDTPALTAKKSV